MMNFTIFPPRPFGLISWFFFQGYLTNLFLSLRTFDKFWDFFSKDHVTKFMICFLRQFNKLHYIFLKNIWQISWFCLCDNLENFAIFLWNHLMNFLIFSLIKSLDLWYFSATNWQNSQFFITDRHALKLHSVNGLKSCSVSKIFM